MITQARISLLTAARKNIAGLCARHSSEQLNLIPDGLNNNLIWNAGHVIATMELLTYGLAGLPTPSPRSFIDRYRKGSRPDGPASAEDLAYINEQLMASVDRLNTDLESLDWSNYKTYTTSFGVTLGSIDDAMAFNNMHETLHLGTMLAISKLVA